METYGVTVEQCLKGTSLSVEQAWGREGGMTLDQEFSLYRNLLSLSGDKQLGLKLGGLYQPQAYGIFGYALMSARNISTLLDISSHFFDLSYSHFRLVISQQGERLEHRYEPRYPLPDDLIQLFSDRDTEAVFSLFDSVGMDKPIINEVHFCYRDDKSLPRCEEHFGCTVKMGQPFNAVFIPSSLTTQELPWQNERAMAACIQACKELLNEIRNQGSLKSWVVDELISTPGKYPSIEQIAEKLATSTRSLRRKLQQEGTSYQGLLQEVRLKLAKQYLRDSFTVEQIAELMGYSETSAFSRAFKSWTGHTPQSFRT